MEQQEKNKETLKALYNEVMNSGNLGAAEKYVTVDRPDHDPAFPPELLAGREGFQKAIGWLRSVFPDIKFTPEFMVAENDYVVCYATVEGTHQGDLMGIPPTNKKFKLNNVDICRFNSEGLIAEHWGTFNMAELMKQLGLMPQK